MKHPATAFLIVVLLIPTALAESVTTDHRPTSKGSVPVVEIFEFDQEYGTLKRAVSGVPRASPDPASEALDRWRASAEKFTHAFAISRGASGSESFIARRVYEDQIGEAHVRLVQTIAGLAVVGAELIVHVDNDTGKIIGINGRFAIDHGLPRSSTANAADALNAAVREFDLFSAEIEGIPHLTYIVDKQNKIRLAWTTTVSYSSAQGREVDRIYADALTGSAVARHQLVRRANREMYDCLDRDKWALCVRLFTEGGSSPIPKVMAAYNNAGIAWDYFAARFGRNGADGRGGVLRQGVNFAHDTYSNAGWDPSGARQGIVYGDAVGSHSAPLGNSLDIVAHEFAHGVTYSEAGFARDGEYGADEQAAIDEGLADCFAVAVDAYRDGTPDWWIAEDIGNAMRYLDDPARRRGQSDYYPTRSFGEAHQNAGITGLAFYLLSQGGRHPRRASVYVNAQGIERAERIFYHALLAYMTSDTTFYTLEGYTLKAASVLHGFQSDTYNAVANAWVAVGNHWKGYGMLDPPGAFWRSEPYTTVSTGLHSGVLTGGAEHSVYLERLVGSTWVLYARYDGDAAKKVLEVHVTPGTFRWRVNLGSNSSGFDLVWNHPE